MRRYLQVWRLPSAPLLLLAGTVGRLPVGIVPLALLLLVEGRTGSYAAAGIATALYALATASVAPLLGRLADRRGPRPVLLATGVAYPTLLGLLVLALAAAAPLWVVFAASAGAGAAYPLLSSALRALWNDLATDDGVRQTAYALDATAMELVWTLGPVAVAVVVTFWSPAVALVGSGLVALAGTLMVAASAPARRWQPVSVPAGTRRGSPLRERALALLFAVFGLLMFGFGVLEITVVAFADAAGRSALGGVLLAVWSTGSMIGGFWFGTRRFALPAVAQYRWALLAVAAGLAPLAFWPNPWLVGAFLFVSGTALAPAMTVQSGLVADLAPAGTLTEAFTWITTMMFGAGALGAAIGGVVVELRGGVALGFGLSALSAFLAWVLVWLPGTPLTRRPVVAGAVAAPRPAVAVPRPAAVSRPGATPGRAA